MGQQWPTVKRNEKKKGLRVLSGWGISASKQKGKGELGAQRLTYSHKGRENESPKKLQKEERKDRAAKKRTRYWEWGLS